jgi:DAK2 domain fusion protein YloV
MKAVQVLKEMINSGVNNLYNFYPQTDKLNVFPVPDGDTGTNMNLTCTNGFAEIEHDDNLQPKEMLTRFARGLIMGARGNSGVIFSQIMKGFAMGFNEDEVTTTAATWKRCLENAKNIAYKAVMKPVEGTILTVIRETYENTVDLDDNMSDLDFWKAVVKVANVSLENTPNLLPMLKEVGVVDSGGFGLVKFFEGMLHYLEKGKIITKLKKLEENTGQNVDFDIEDGEFGYCTEAIVMLAEENIETLKVDTVRNKFDEFGNSSIVAVKDEDILKIHTHALQPGQVLTYLQQFGEFKKIKVENMSLQADEHVKGGNPNIAKGQGRTIEEKRTLEHEVATIAVVGSKEMATYFENDLNVSFALNGGSKMNPSTADFLDAIKKVNAKTVFIFPNDSNVILAAEQARDNEKESKIYIVPTKTIPQGVTALIAFDEDEKPNKIVSDLTKTIKNVVSYSITEAARDANLNGVNVKAGEIIGVADKKIVYSGATLAEVVTKSLTKYITSKTEILTIFRGANAKLKDTLFLRKYLDENCDVEYELNDGGQEVYDFIIGIE